MDDSKVSKRRRQTSKTKTSGESSTESKKNMPAKNNRNLILYLFLASALGLLVYLNLDLLFKDAYRDNVEVKIELLPQKTPSIPVESESFVLDEHLSESTAKDEVSTEAKIPKIIAIGDLHGDLENTVRTFKMAGLIDDSLNWVAGNSIFVQTGDIVDRGPDTIALYRLMQKLIKQAEDAGGQVHALLGNHEIMNLGYDWRYVTQEDLDSFGGIENRVRDWSKDGWIGKYLASLKLAVNVNGTVFFHGGANVHWSLSGIDGINQYAKYALDTYDPLKYKFVDLFGDGGPLWYRGYALDPEHSVCVELKKALANFKATRMVVGHTPQMSGKVLSRCEHLVYVIDVGISRVYGGHSAALEIHGNQITALYPSKRVVLSGNQ